MAQPLHDLKTELYSLQIKRLDVANYCQLSYSQLGNYLNGITPIPYVIERKIRECIEEKKKQLLMNPHSRFMGV